MKKLLIAAVILGGVNVFLSIVNNLKLNKMADQNDASFDEVLNELDKATDDVAAELEMFRGVIQDQGLPKSVEDDIKNRLTGMAGRLRAMAKPASPASDVTGGGTGNLGGSGGSDGPTSSDLGSSSE